jgi:malate synthase
MSTAADVVGLELTGPIEGRFDEALTPRALELVALLHCELNGRRRERLAARQERVQLSNGEKVTRELVERLTDEEVQAISPARGDAFASGRWDDARALFLEMAVSDEYSDFLTLPAYEPMP